MPAAAWAPHTPRYALSRRNIFFCAGQGLGMPLLIAALSVILLHRADGGAVVVYPRHVTSLHARPAAAGGNRIVAPAAGCVIWLDDGRMLSVLESCEVVVLRLRGQ
jgi:hypothetical protein